MCIPFEKAHIWKIESAVVAYDDDTDSGWSTSERSYQTNSYYYGLQ